MQAFLDNGYKKKPLKLFNGLPPLIPITTVGPSGAAPSTAAFYGLMTDTTDYERL